MGSGQLGLLLRYVEILASYERANVIGDRDPERIVKRHLLDSLSCASGGLMDDVRDLVDIGSGGGLPGIPLAILLPQVDVLLVESTGKKAAFMCRVIRELSISNARVWMGRVEELARTRSREGFQVAVSRAVGALDVVLEYSLPLVEIGGMAVAMKGAVSEDELSGGERAAAILGGGRPSVRPVEFLPEVGNVGHRLVLVRKESGTPGDFPRASGRIRRAPLGGGR
ncbi:16S rRNA (guanine(527)-N(7))-methyltransferase RsmG [Rubrobacter calidifluminis]|uniref:16S rRNA (guanine(527)-N(7))-methyltransferase RsmG n=1 Tax=Rubrobacter calidifluminis TaxID=1392640 RepID=UPI00236261F4|nr:16S rRNA (guanine(527)-N(7))-methyltransferase RsmG [Rubrobacter calidifluminis]